MGARKPVLPPEGLHWFCVRTKRLSEGISAQALRSEIGLEVFCPMIRFQRARRSGKVWVREALFPNYLFSRFDFFENFRRVQAARGVLKIVGFGGVPAPVAGAIITELRSRFGDAETVQMESSVQPGEEVKIIGGPFQGISALVTHVLPAKQRVAILLELLGTEREVEVSVEHIIGEQSHPLLAPTAPPR